MSNIVKKEDIVFLPGLDEPQKEMVRSAKTKGISDLTQKEIELELNDAISAAILVVGNKSIDIADLSIMNQQVGKYIRENHQFCRIGEIKNAIRLGSFGKYKKDRDVLFISPANIIHWVKCYEGEKMETLTKQLRYERDVLRKEQEREENKEKERIYYEELPDKIAECLKVRNDEMALFYFRDLWKMKLIQMDKEEINVLRENAKKEVHKELEEQRVRISRVRKDELEAKYDKKAGMKAFYLWLEENRDKDIKVMIKEAIFKEGLI